MFLGLDSILYIQQCFLTLGSRSYLGSLGMHMGWQEVSKTEIIIFNELNYVGLKYMS